jgi:hypothetical protein
MARRRRSDGVTFADMLAHLGRFVPEAWLDPRYYAAARVAWCRAHGWSVVDVRLAERAERLRLVRSTTRCGRSPPMVNRRVMAMTDDARDQFLST